jgi:hypothetical protein
MLGSNPSPHRHVPFTFFPKIYTKNATPPSPLGERGVKEIKKIVGKAIKRHYLHICITEYNVFSIMETGNG